MPRILRAQRETASESSPASQSSPPKKRSLPKKQPAPKHEQYMFYQPDPSKKFPNKRIDCFLIFKLKDPPLWDYESQQWRYTASRDLTFLEDEIVLVDDVNKKKKEFEELKKKDAAKRKAKADAADAELRKKAKLYKSHREQNIAELQSVSAEAATLRKTVKLLNAEITTLKLKLSQEKAK
jgi:hypothetical protein